MKRSVLLFLVSFLQGGTIMGYELLIPKLIAPFFGSSLYVWSSSLINAMLGLACGYYFSGKINSGNIAARGRNILTGASLFILIVTLGSRQINSMLLELPLKQGIVLSSVIHLFPVYFLLGMISPLIIILLVQLGRPAGKASGQVFACSTLAGIFFSMLTGFYLIPETGIHVSAFVLAFTAFFPAIILHGISIARNL